MPTYEYECKDCGHTFEAFQSMRDDPLKDCPKCGKEVRRLIFGGAGVIFKGSGFYATDAKPASDTKPTEAKPAEKPPEKPASSETAASPCANCPKKGETCSA